jgi:DNA replication factor GINS
MTEASAMDLDELQSVRDRERQTDKLQQLRTSFYADAGKFIQELRDTRARAADRADDPFDAPEVNRLSDEIDTAEQTVEAIYEKRVGKIVKAASFAAADLPAEVDGMTAEEEELFDSLVADIKKNRRHVLDVLAGETDSIPIGGEETGQSQAAGEESVPASDRTPAPSEPKSESDPESTPSESPSKPDRPSGVSEPDRSDTGGTDRPHSPPETSSGPSGDTQSEVSAADLMGGGSGTSNGEAPDTGKNTQSAGSSERDSRGPPSQVADSEAETEEKNPPVRNDGGTTTESIDRTTVRITDDVGAIFGVDQREYDLSANDVVTLPAQNADPLLDRDAAEPLD